MQCRQAAKPGQERDGRVAASLLSWVPTGEGALERKLVRMLQSAASGQAMSDAGRADVQGREDFRKVVRRCLAFHIGAQCEDDFRRVFFADSLEQRGNSQLSGADVLEWRKPSAKRVVEALKDPAALERKDVGGLFDDANFFPLS